MPKLTPGRPVVTDEPVLKVENKLVAGSVLRFQLRVFDDDGNVSEPDVVSVRVGAFASPREFSSRRLTPASADETDNPADSNFKRAN